MENNFYIVGIGASAGGLEALERMFQAMPENSGMAFVVVQHLSPDFKSLMDELLARHTRMPIHRAENGTIVEPNSLYLIPPKQLLSIAEGKLFLTAKDNKQLPSLPIDHFFSSLAKERAQMSIAVVLSGTGSDGSRGLRDIHEAGGLVVCQSVESAKFDGMPKSAIDTNLVDVVTTAEKIPELLERYAAHPIRSQLQLPPINESSLEHVFRLLQERHRIDFNYYKPTTIGRRIERRIQLNHHGNIDDYVQRLEADPAEIDQLYKDLLIGVTRFFRDQEAFETLRNEILPELLSAHHENEEFRVWVAACGTGEEAYSIAIMINECMQEMNLRFAVKIFATDVHQASLDVAHVGIYSAASVEEISDERRNHHFHKTDAGYQILPEIRKMIVFAPHNLIRDAPFTRLNLVTCRNFLIYLGTKAQKKVLSLFHFGLKAGSVMFMGASESPGELGDEFETLNERWKFFRKIRDVRLPAEMRAPLSLGSTTLRNASTPTSRSLTAHNSELIATYDELLGRFMPPGILVNDRRELIHVFGGAGKYLALGDGRLSNNLLEMASEDLKLALVGGIQRVSKSGQTVNYKRVRISLPEGEVLVGLSISPVCKRGLNNKYLITFDELDEQEVAEPSRFETLNLDELSRGQLVELEHELRYTKENLQATIEELETSNEELQATNEEMVASNEELQSTNEELHSVNEELYTVNAEYQNKISELTELTNDMDNLLASTEVHTLFLDSSLCVRKFTPKMAEVFNLVPHDIGRRIDAFSHNIDCDDLAKQVSQVLETSRPTENHVQDKHGHWFLMRILPYRTVKETSGVVLTLIDISQLVAAQRAALLEQENFQRAIAANRDGTWDWKDINRDEMWWSANCYTLLGYEPDEFPALHSAWMSLIHPDDRKRVSETSIPDNDKCYVEVHRDFEYRMKHKTDGYRWFRHRAIVDNDEFGNPIRMTGSVGDIHDRKCAEMQYIEEIQRRDNFLAMLSHELRNPMGAVLNAIEFSKELAATTETNDATGRSSDLSCDELPPMKIVERQTRHMARLLDDLLDVARFGQSKIEFRMEVVDLTVLADDVLEAVRYEFSAKRQVLEKDFCARPLRVSADPARIKQAQVNLLSNASKFAPDEGKILFHIGQEGSEAVISVRDFGEGIVAENLANIFDLFVQSDDSLSRCLGGMGVGLSLARTIVEAHQGNILALSDGPGTGSTFQIRLPLTENEVEPQPPAPHATFEKCRVLIVEDNPEARGMLAKTLRLKGFDVAVAADGQAALEQFHNFQPDVAVIDIGLPVMDGYTLARQIRRIAKFDKTKLIALTGYGQASDKCNSSQAGFDAHLVKPLNHGDLYQLISNRKHSNLVAP